MVQGALTHDEQPFLPSFPPFSLAFLDCPSYRNIQVGQSPICNVCQSLCLQSSVICANHTFDLSKLSSGSGFTLFTAC